MLILTCCGNYLFYFDIMIIRLDFPNFILGRNTYIQLQLMTTTANTLRPKSKYRLYYYKMCTHDFIEIPLFL